MSNASEIQTTSNEVAAKYAIYAMIAANTYHKPESERIYFPIEKIGWQLVDIDGNPTNKPTKEHDFSGLAYDIYEKDATNEVIFSFRGTENYKDFLWANFSVPPFNVQYRQALKSVGSYLAKNGNKNILVAGHSLGGGLSLCVSVHYGLKAITFNPSPRVFDGVGDYHAPAERIVFFEKGEILDTVRKIWTKDNEVVAKNNIYLCDYGFGTGSIEKHRADYLAFGLLIQGAKVDSTLKIILDSILATQLDSIPSSLISLLKEA